MNKLKTYIKEKQVYNMFYMVIEKFGYFNENFDLDLVSEIIGATLQIAKHKVRRIYFKDFRPNNKRFLMEYEY